MVINPNGGELLGPFLAIVAAFLILFIVILIALYIYVSLVFMAIAKKTKYSSPGVAWISVVGPLLIASSAAKMHWWPVLLLIGTGIPIIGFILGVAFAVFYIMWMWKTFEKLGRPGWWAILLLMSIVNLILLGIAAWSKK